MIDTSLPALLNKLYRGIENIDDFPRSLFLGTFGVALYKFLYIKYVEEGDFSQEFISDIQDLAESSINDNFPTFSNGQAGMNWFFSYLYECEFIEPEDWEILCEQDSKLTSIAIRYLDNGNYDFLHGAIGIAYHILYKKQNDYPLFFYDFFCRLNSIMFNGNYIIPDFDQYTQRIIFDRVNLGLAHGLPSILKFCLECYKKNISKNESKNLAMKIINYLLENANSDKSSNYYPVAIENEGKSLGLFSRLAWCYGDLGVGFVLYQSGVLFEDFRIKSFALEILKHTVKRRSKEETGINDAGICHGTAGIAHIYNKLWHYTEDPIFKEACDYWINETINLANFSEGSCGYTRYNPISHEHENNSSFLEGTAGVGLVLLSYITGDFSWDYCIMLND